MSHEYSWIKTGTKVIAVNTDVGDRDENNGVVFTVACEPFQLHPMHAILEQINPRHWFVEAEDTVGYLNCRYLRPYKEDDDSKSVTTWDDIANLIGVDIRRLEKTE